MSHDIANKLAALLAEADQSAVLIEDVTREFRAHMLPKFNHNSGQYNRFYNLLLLLDDEYCDQPASSFGPVKLAEIRKYFIRAGNCRKYVNSQTRNVIRIFRFAVARELIKSDQVAALEALEPLKPGEAPDNPPRAAAALDDVQRTYAFLSPMLRTMVALQVATGCRPSELFRMRPCDIDRSGRIWIYRPPKHKTSKHVKSKPIPILPELQHSLAPYLLKESTDFCFITFHGNQWSQGSYRQQIYKAADKAGVKRWLPYSTRHLAAQTVRERAGLDAAKSLLGHTSSRVTEAHYAALRESEAIAAAKLSPRVM